MTHYRVEYKAFTNGKWMHGGTFVDKARALERARELTARHGVETKTITQESLTKRAWDRVQSGK